MGPAWAGCARPGTLVQDTWTASGCGFRGLDESRQRDRVAGGAQLVANAAPSDWLCQDTSKLRASAIEDQIRFGFTRHAKLPRSELEYFGRYGARHDLVERRHGRHWLIRIAAFEVGIGNPRLRTHLFALEHPTIDEPKAIQTRTVRSLHGHVAADVLDAGAAGNDVYAG